MASERKWLLTRKKKIEKSIEKILKCSKAVVEYLTDAPYILY